MVLPCMCVMTEPIHVSHNAKCSVPFITSGTGVCECVPVTTGYTSQWLFTVRVLYVCVCVRIVGPLFTCLLMFIQ